jgi:hypothetical protein
VRPARSVLIVVVLLSVCNMRGVDELERSRVLAAIASAEAAIASAEAEAAGLRHAANVELARVMHEAIEAGASPVEVASCVSACEFVGAVYVVAWVSSAGWSEAESVGLKFFSGLSHISA